MRLTLRFLRGQRSGYAKIPLDGSVISLLKQGENVIKVTGTSAGSDENALDIGLDGVLEDKPLAATPVRKDAGSIAVPDPDFSAVLVKARRKAESMPFVEGVSADEPERLLVRDSHDRFRSALEAACAELKEDALVKAMGSPASYWRYLAWQSLSKRGEDGWRVAVSCLTNVNWRIRSAACDAVSLMDSAAAAPSGKADAVKRMTGLLKDDNAWVRCRAAAALGPLGKGDANAVKGLLQLSSDKDSWVRRTAVSALVKATEDPATLLKAACDGLMIPDTSFFMIGSCLPLIDQYGNDEEAVISALVFAVENPGEGMGAESFNKVMEQLVKRDGEGRRAVLAIAKVAEGGNFYDRLRGNPRKRAIELLGEMGVKAAPVRSVLESITSGTAEREAPLREAAENALRSIRKSAE